MPLRRLPSQPSIPAPTRRPPGPTSNASTVSSNALLSWVCHSRRPSRGRSDAPRWSRGPGAVPLFVHHFGSKPVYMDVKTETPQLEVDAADWVELRARLRSFVAPRIRGDAASVDDLVQEILLRLHRALPRLR